MRIPLLALIAALAFLGCSKKAGPTSEAAAAGPEAAPSAAPTVDNPMIASAMDDLTRKVQQQQYDAAVGALVSLSQMPKSDKQQAEYTARLRETELALSKRAQQGDAGAAQSAEMLGRMITGR